ncbi:T9SS type A sorting domain-containing protein [Lutibacter sp. TH_r2]|uniref:T9SS type A sorting domain-containing protein n=1 Tax=Lutibacter sp. TH_r2 TaxID=3082083 RepID=UPI002952C5F3|nr:T9SS type A sorting domain-containing protein [Lutibacter sp. TH_r2]MDV7185856.1 T9SS type A sorting domain-containing protein [Lutibacter sp. TH_r2]
MKKLLLLVALVATTLSYGQYTITFDEATPGYTIAAQGTGQTTSDKIANPATTGNESGGDVLRFTVNANVGFWAYPFLGLNSSGTQVNSTLGKYFTLQFLSPHSDGSIYFYPWIGGVKQSAFISNFTGASTSEWKTIEFDLTSATEGYISRMDFEIHTGTELVAGDVYYIDNIKQLLNSTLSIENVALNHIKVYPNPTSDFIHISDLTDIETISIHNVLGKEVKSFKAQKTIDISNLSTGIYYLQTNNGLKRKIIKQ